MIRGIIFDLDGTLVQLPIRYDYLHNELKKLLDTDDELIPLIPSIVNLARNGNMIKEAFEIICREEIQSVNGMTIISGAEELLTYLKTRNYLLGLVTLQCKTATEQILSKIGISNLFNSILTRDDSHDRLDQIKKTLHRLGLSPSETIMIGDRLNDIESAQNMGCQSILVSNKENHLRRLDINTIRKLSDIKNYKLLNTNI